MTSDEISKLARQAGSAFGGLPDILEGLGDFRRQVGPLFFEVGLHQNRGEEIVEVMGHAAGQLADGFEFLRLPDLIFKTFALGDILQRAHHVSVFAFLDTSQTTHFSPQMATG